MADDAAAALPWLSACLAVAVSCFSWTAKIKRCFLFFSCGYFLPAAASGFLLGFWGSLGWLVVVGRRGGADGVVGCGLVSFCFLSSFFCCSKHH